ncbi:hypothetical protein [Streptomyces sp. SID12488]|uniref:hypothetical protein n=1 Tax=Streptomyces sp. SID12488 TaxID=2706040 RepID=UPI001945B29F|nr:hypothetical protein [Streptomyces sp. SID12488]
MPRQRHAGTPVHAGRSGGRGAHAQPRSGGNGAPGATGSAGTFPGRPWENPAEFGHTHDPHEVTVQLDGVGRQFEELLVRQATEGPDAGPGDGPVFVDETGRRSRRYRRIGMAVGISCAVYAVVIVATLLSGNSDAPWLPVPGQQDEQPAGKVDTSPLPAESVRPSDSPGVVPAPGTSVSAGVTPPQGTAPVTPGTSPSAATKPGATLAPSASASAGKPDPGTTTPGPAPEPSVSVSSAPPEPSPSESVVTSPDPSPSPSPATDGGTGTVANGPSDPTPIAESPAEPSGSGATGDPGASTAPAGSTA